MDTELCEISVQGIDEKIGFLGNDDRGYLHQSGFTGFQPTPRPRAITPSRQVVVAESELRLPDQRRYFRNRAPIRRL